MNKLLKIKAAFNKLIYLHKFFVKESKSYVGVLKKDKSKPMRPTWGYMQDYQTKPFSLKNKVWTINGVEYPKVWRYNFKELIYFPIAYFKFMKLSLKN